ncbi:glycosyltransferase, partial [bacterium]|nr:glycosyltransferase [bacterium]
MSRFLSIIIVNWNTRGILEECLISLNSIDWKDVGIGYEIIVVDNASEDNSVEMVKGNFPDVRVIACTTNIGFGPAVNKAVEIATGDFYLISNADVIYSVSPINGMLSCLHSDSTISAVAPKIVDRSGNKQPSSFKFPTLKRLAFEQFFSCGNFGEILPYDNRSEKKINEIRYIDVDWVLGACFMIKSEVFREVKGFCE